MNEICCEDCKFSASLDEEHHYAKVALQCRRYPTLIKAATYINLVRKESWCGEWKPRMAAPYAKKQTDTLMKNINKHLVDMVEEEI